MDKDKESHEKNSVQLFPHTATECGASMHADQTFTATNSADSGAGSLRWALTEPCTDTHTVNFGIANTSIVLQSSLTITGEVVIAGVEHSAQRMRGPMTTATMTAFPIPGSDAGA